MIDFDDFYDDDDDDNHDHPIMFSLLCVLDLLL